MIRGSVPLWAYIIISLFIYFRIVYGLDLKTRGRAVLGSFFILVLLSFILYAQLPQGIISLICMPLTIFFMGSLLIAFSFFVIELLLSMILKKERKKIVITVLITIFSVSVCSLIIGTRDPVIRNVSIFLKELPAELNGFTILQISDLHIEGRTAKPEKLINLVKKINSLKPDLIVFTGDLLSALLIEDVSAFSAIFRKIRCRFGVYAVTGNTDFGNGLRTYNKFVKEAKINVLVNEYKRLDNGIILTGVDDKYGSKSSVKNRGWNIEQTFSGVSKNLPVIFLSHRPDLFDKSVGYGVDLQLSGHTHAGQIPPLDIFSKLYFKYSSGLYKKGYSYLYVSSGAGTWPYIPMRLFSRNEIVRIQLKKAVSKKI